MLAIKNLTLNAWQEQENVIQGWNINKAINGTLDYAVVKYISTGANGYSICYTTILMFDINMLKLRNIKDLTGIDRSCSLLIRPTMLPH